MPGAYAHITLVNEAILGKNLGSREGIPDTAKRLCGKWLKFIELGAVSPDYPYLVLGSKPAAAWADTMHKYATGRRIAAGVDAIRGLGGEEQEKATAWLLGFAAHTFTDITIHPAVNLLVGPYEQNKKDHRVCEMHQDAYICGRLGYGDIGLYEHLDSGIRRCGPDGDEAGLDDVVVHVWDAMLQVSDPAMHETSQPDFHRWHNRFTLMVDSLAEEGGALFAFARHLMTAAGAVYPVGNEVDKPKFIDACQVPLMSVMTYDELFDRAIQNVLVAWGYITRGIFQADEAYKDWLQDYSLDTGTLIDSVTGEPTTDDFLFWK